MINSAKRKPLALHVHDPKQHLTKEAKEARADSEITMGTLNFSVPSDVKKDKLALKKWHEVIKIYKDAGLTIVSSTDTGVIARYCMLYSEYWQLLETRRAISDMDFPEDDMVEMMALSEAEYRAARARRLWSIMEYFTRLDGLLRLDDKIHRKLKTILDIEDRIFLNPASKVRTLPIRRKPEEKDHLEDLGFNV